MFATENVKTILSLVGEDYKGPGDYSFSDIHIHVAHSTGAISERSLRRIIRGLRIQKGDRGYYTTPDVAMIVGWIKRRSKYASYEEYRLREGRQIYKKAQQLNL